MRSDQFWESVFTPYRRSILYPIAAVGATIFIPLAVHDFMRGRTVVAAILLCIVAMLATNALALARKKAPPIPFAVLMVPAYTGVGFALLKYGMQGALWTYPVMLLTFFTLPQRSANTVAAALALTALFVVGLTQDPGTTLRYALSVSLSLVVINIMLNVVTSMHQRLMEQTITDPLTGAFNRRYMDANLAEAIERRRRTNAPATVMLIDIDHFKRINDRHGHDVGDTALKSLVAIVRERRRKLDMLFRQGGEEFLLLLPDTRAAEALGVAESLRSSVATAPILRDSRVTVSIGVAELRDDEDVRSWMKRVDEALYRAKNGGRNRVVSADLDALAASTKALLRRISAS